MTTQEGSFWLVSSTISRQGTRGAIFLSGLMKSHVIGKKKWPMYFLVRNRDWQLKWMCWRVKFVFVEHEKNRLGDELVKAKKKMEKVKRTVEALQQNLGVVVIIPCVVALWKVKMIVEAPQQNLLWPFNYLKPNLFVSNLLLYRTNTFFTHWKGQEEERKKVKEDEKGNKVTDFFLAKINLLC